MTNNLLSNLLTIGILIVIFIILYCKIKGITLGDMFRDIKEGIIE